MPLPNVLNGTARQCHAIAKHTKQRCLNLAAYNTKVCRFHGSQNPESVIKGEAHHWYKTGTDTRKSRRELSAKIRELKVYAELLDSEKPIFEIPLDTKEAKLINKISDKALEKIVKNAVKVVDKKHKTKKSPENKPQ